MSTLANLLRQRIEALGYTELKECARERDIPYELLRKVISDGHLPKDKTLLLYAERLEMDLEVLLAAAYRQRAPRDMRHLFSGMNTLPANPEGSRLAPVLGKAACGEWLESYAAEPDAYAPVEGNDPDAFFVIAEGESMLGGNITPGALLLVTPGSPTHNGNIVLARLGTDEFTVKVLYKQADGTTILQPMNSAYEPLVVPPEEPLTVMRISEIRIPV